MRAVTIVAVSILGATLPAGLASAQTTKPDTLAEAFRARLHVRVPTLLEETLVPGAAVALLRNGEVVWITGHGYADLERRTPVEPSTVFNIGSISKTVAAWGVMRLVDDYTSPKPDIQNIANACTYMGHDLFNPPTVEGWHTGQEWIDSGAMVERVNFAADQVGDISKPGVRRIVESLAALGVFMTPEQLVDGCLDLIGPVGVSPARREELIAHVSRGGEVRCGTHEERQSFDERVARLLQLIVAAPEFQFS